jgi:hypothetical protein
MRERGRARHSWRRGSQSSRREGCERRIPWAGLLAPGRRESPHDEPLHLPTRQSGSGLSKEAHPVTVARPHRSCTGFPGTHAEARAPLRESAYSVVRQEYTAASSRPSMRRAAILGEDAQKVFLDAQYQKLSIYGNLDHLCCAIRVGASWRAMVGWRGFARKCFTSECESGVYAANGSLLVARSTRKPRYRRSSFGFCHLASCSPLGCHTVRQHIWRRSRT